MNETNRAIVASVLAAIDEFSAGHLTMDEAQGRLQTSLGLLEREPGASSSAIRLAEAGLEEIRFTRLLDEQRPAAVFRLDELRSALESERDD